MNATTLNAGRKIGFSMSSSTAFETSLSASGKRPRPDHATAKARRDAAIKEADRQLDADIKALFLQYGVNDNRYN